MKTVKSLILETGYLDPGQKLPHFCRKQNLRFRFALAFPQEEAFVDLILLFVKRLLKLFPFEKMRIEVEKGRVKDVFNDWDSYLEWFHAEPFKPERLFKRLEVGRLTKCLGYFHWENLPGDQTTKWLALYTESNQSEPFLETCRQIAKENSVECELRLGSLFPKKTGFKSQIYDWAFNFLNSSVKRGTTSKRSPTKP